MAANRAHTFLKKWTGSYRDPRYVVSLVFGAAVLIYTTVQVLQTSGPDSFDTNVFHFIYGGPHWLYVPFLLITQMGTVSAVLLWSAAGWYARNLQLAAAVLLSGIAGWIVAKPLKVFVDRGRPGDLLHIEKLISPEQFSGLGYPSGHATVAAACATALYFNVERKYRKYLVLVVFLVGLSRVYLGAHFPRDVIGGWALGITVGSAISLAVGSTRRKISMARLKKRLADVGIDAGHAESMNVDARGSVPVRVTDTQGKDYMVKLFGKQEYAADWLFKTVRFFRFKSLSDEQPFLSSKQNVEHEAVAAMTAGVRGVRTPEIIGYAQFGSYWLLAQRMVKGKSLNKMTGDAIKDDTLAAVWLEVKKLHAAHIAHRDLRAANIFVDARGRAWIIDFGFAEVAAKPVRKKMDIAELLMSTALIVGPERALKAARKVMGKDAMNGAAPYVQMPVFSGATTSLVRKNKATYKHLQTALKKMANNKEIKEANIQRLKPKYILNIVAAGLFLHFVVPQFKEFRGALHSLISVQYEWVALVLICSALTYAASALVVVALTPTPVSIGDTMLVQVASSYASKLLPAGLGSATLVTQYLRRVGLDITTAATVLVSQRLIGFITTVGPLAVFFLLQGGEVKQLFKFTLPISLAAVLGLALLSVSVAIWIKKSWRRAVADNAGKLMDNFRELAGNPKEVSVAAVFAFGLTLSYILCLYFSMVAVGMHVTFAVALVVFTTGTIAGSVSPTPGGLGALELAMIATLIGLGFPQPQAYSSVILYRLATFWAPIPFGVAAYHYIQKKDLV
jgi:uncharacterized protein (TIRG00374 family)